MLLTEAFQCYRLECVHIIDWNVYMLLTGVCMLLTGVCTCY